MTDTFTGHGGILANAQALVAALPPDRQATAQAVLDQLESGLGAAAAEYNATATAVWNRHTAGLDAESPEVPAGVIDALFADWGAAMEAFSRRSETVWLSLCRSRNERRQRRKEQEQARRNIRRFMRRKCQELTSQVVVKEDLDAFFADELGDLMGFATGG